MNIKIPLGKLVVISSVLLVSCGEDPKLVAKVEQQKAEISKLRGEIALVDEKLKNLPPDVSSELAITRELADKQNTEVAALEKEIETLEQRKASLQSEFDTYKIKYQLK